MDLNHVSCTFRDGVERRWDPDRECWTRRVEPSPSPTPAPLPEGHRSGTPKQLAAQALSEGKLSLAAGFLELGEGCSL